MNAGSFLEDKGKNDLEEAEGGKGVHLHILADGRDSVIPSLFQKES